jgi:hypothetical protein
MESIEQRFENALIPLKKAVQEHKKAADRLCEKIDQSNGQIRKAVFSGMASSGMSAMPGNKR